MDQPKHFTGRGHQLIIDDLDRLNLQPITTVKHYAPEGEVAAIQTTYDHPYIQGLEAWYAPRTTTTHFISWAYAA